MPGHGSSPAGAPRAAAARPRAPQRRHPADDLSLAARDLENLADRLRRGARSHNEVHQLEEEAQRICREILTPFRGPDARPKAAPLLISPCGQKVWF